MIADAASVKPILVIGINRSGTKWLSNEIASHPSISAVQDERHGGIVESNLLTEYGRAFDLTTSTGYAELLAFWTQIHFFLLAGGQTEWFETADPRPTDSHAVFRP